jgi:MFS family permease
VSGLLTHTFRSLRGFNYRMYAAGALISNVGTWMQRIAQDWIVLTQLTPHNATAVGVVTALQFGPQAALLPLTGYAADHLDRRKVMMATQSTLGVLALILGVLCITGRVQLWHVYLLALLQGCATAFDAPARQTFVAVLVGDSDLSNAVALNSTSFSVARMIGPAIAGVLISAVGAGWVFLINATTFAAVILSLCLLRVHELHVQNRGEPAPSSLLDGFRYVAGRPDLTAAMLMLFLIGTLGFNFPIFISTMAVSAFQVGARQYGLLNSMMAIGSICGALMAARRTRPRLVVVLAAAAAFGCGFSLAAIAPTYWLFGGALLIIGVCAQTFSTSALSLLQLSTIPGMRGRVMAIGLAVSLGSMPIGSPIVGRVADAFGPRWALALGAASGFAAAIAGLRYLIKYRRLRVRLERGRLRFSLQSINATLLHR